MIFLTLKNKLRSSLIIALAMLTLLVSCGSKEPAQEARKPSVPDETIVEFDDKYRNFYEIFVRSFKDSNGDGYGDLNGITEKLDYLKPPSGAAANYSLGINGIWLMPICPSPSYHKYDVTDYCAIDPMYGTMEDFENLVQKCHDRKITLIIDMVVNHTSDKHEWFVKFCDVVKCRQNGETSQYDEKYGEYYTCYTEEELLEMGAIKITQPDSDYDGQNLFPFLHLLSLHWYGFHLFARGDGLGASGGEVAELHGKFLDGLLRQQNVHRHIRAVVEPVHRAAHGEDGGFDAFKEPVGAPYVDRDPSSDGGDARGGQRVLRAFGIGAQKPARAEQDAAEIARDDADDVCDVLALEHLEHRNAGAALRLAVVRVALGPVLNAVAPAVVPRIMILLFHRGDKVPRLVLRGDAAHMAEKRGALFRQLRLPGRSGNIIWIDGDHLA